MTKYRESTSLPTQHTHDAIYITLQPHVANRMVDFHWMLKQPLTFSLVKQLCISRMTMLSEVAMSVIPGIRFIGEKLDKVFE